MVFGKGKGELDVICFVVLYCFCFKAKSGHYNNLIRSSA